MPNYSIMEQPEQPQQQNVQEDIRKVKHMDKDDPRYQQWLAQKSCTNYDHDKRLGEIRNTAEEKSEKVEYMFSKKIKMILCNSDLAVFLLTDEGEVYHWWNDSLHYYSQMINLQSTKIVLTATSGNFTFIAQTDDERVYYFQTHHHINGFPWMKQAHFEKKVISLSCGDSFFVVVTEDNKVYTWGRNNHGQLGNSERTEKFIEEPQEIKFTDVKIVKVACGRTHTLALTDTGEMFVWGGNTFGELGFDHRDEIIFPMANKKMSEMEILDITAMKNMSSAIGKDGLIYLWGSCFDQQINKPIACEYTTLFDMCDALCARPPTSIKYLNAGEQLKILKDIKDAFNDKETSDLTLKVEGKDIFVHKIILQCRSSYFKDLFKTIDKTIDKNVFPSVINLNQFSYATYMAYLRYLYTGVINVSSEEKFDISKFDQIFKKDERFGRSCFRAIQRKITVDNVIFFYKMAKEHNEKELEKYCLEFFDENATAVVQTTMFLALDADLKTILKARMN